MRMQTERAAVVVRGAVEGVAGGVVVVVGSRGRSRNSSSGIQSRRPRPCPRPSSSIYLFLAVVIMAMIFLAMLLSSPLQWLHATMFIVAAFIHVDVFFSDPQLSLGPLEYDSGCYCVCSWTSSCHFYYRGCLSFPACSVDLAQVWD